MPSSGTMCHMIRLEGCRNEACCQPWDLKLERLGTPESHDLACKSHRGLNVWRDFMMQLSGFWTLTGRLQRSALRFFFLFWWGVKICKTKVLWPLLAALKSHGLHIDVDIWLGLKKSLVSGPRG